MKRRKREDTYGFQMKIKEWTIKISSIKVQTTEEINTEDKEMGMDMEISTGIIKDKEMDMEMEINTGTIKDGDEMKEGGGRKMEGK